MEEPLKITRKNAYDSSSFWTKITFTWIIPLFNRGFKKDLTLDDLYSCSIEDDPKTHADALEREWNKELARREDNPKYKPSIIKAIIRYKGAHFCLTAPLILVVESGIRLVQPLMIGRVVDYLSSADGDMNAASYEEARIGVILIVVSSFVLMFLLHNGFVRHSRHGNNVRSALTHMIYKKVLRLSMSSFEETDIGQILNILANDINRFEELGFLLVYIVAAPLASVFALAITYKFLHRSSFAGFVILILFIPFQGMMGRLFNRFRRETTEITDKRINLMSEIVSAMKLIKVYCWEQPFASIVGTIREQEVAVMKKTYFLEGVNSAVFFVAAKIILFACFVSYILDGNLLTPEVVFVTMSMYNAVRVPVTRIFPNAVGLGSESLVALKRVNEILLLEEKPVDSDCSSANDLEKGHLKFENYHGKWTKNIPIDNLVNINCHVVPGELMIVVGSVGAGKTCLLYAILNEISRVSGSCKVSGSISYAHQGNWCIGSTIKQNILMGSEYDAERYREVIFACGLERDLQLFDNGDETFVGEKGFNLSGGQKARVTLARAVYRDSDVYLLDDPLSAVDPKIANHIFTHCIRGKLLRDKTVILVTHQLQFLKKAEKIMVLKQGKMMTFGRYSELVSSSVEFLSFLDKRRREQERKESLSKQKSLSLNKAPVEEAQTAVVHPAGTLVPSKAVKDINRQEVKLEGAVSFKVVLQYFRAGGSTLFLCSSIFFSFASQGLYHFTDMWLSAWTQIEGRRLEIDELNRTQGNALNISIEKDSLAAGTVFDNQNSNLIFYAVLMIVLFIGSFLRMTLCFYLSLRSSINLHNTIFRRVLRAPMQFFENNPLGRILNRFTRDMGIVDTLIPRSLIEVNLTTFDVLGIAVVSMIVNAWLIIPTLILGALVYPIRMYYVRTARDLHRLDAICRSPVYQKLTETFDGLITIRAFKLEQRCEDQYFRYLRDSVACRFLVFYSMRMLGIGLDVFSNIYITCICLVLIESPKGTIPGGDAGLILSQSLLMVGLFQYTIRMSSELENQMTSAERVLEYAELPSEAELRKPDFAMDKNWPSQGNIQFKGVGLRYTADSDPVLKDLNFNVKAGEKVGIVGRTGAGKSSVISVLFRLVEPTGVIKIDGVDIKSIGLHDLRQKISIIPQDPSLFSGSVRENLDPFKEYGDKDIWSALEEAHLSSAIHELNGLDAHVTEGGSNVSVGQRQLLCMARALLKKNKILVMDEATANVDQETDDLIQRTIKTTFRENTVLTIAHRLNTIIDMDRVMVMDAGRVVEFDAPYLLLRDVTGVFYSMVKQTGPEFCKMLHEMADRSFHHRPSQKIIANKE